MVLLVLLATAAVAVAGGVLVILAINRRATRSAYTY